MNFGYSYHNTLEEHRGTLDGYDNATLREYVTMLSHEPFVTQRQAAEWLGISKQDLLDLNTVIRNDEILQDYIQHSGIGKKYYKNTILPLFATGKIQASILNEYSYPERIGLYTGFSCMFYCNFCGRNYNEKYDRKLADESFAMFTRMIDEDPKTDWNWRNRLRISGGVEPLTNPLTNNIITHGAEQGYNVQLYTNGYLLSDRYCNDNPGIFDLGALRFSIYGVDQKTTFAVTQNDKAFNTVQENIVNFLNRPELKETNVGLNYILLPGKTNEIYGFLDYIRSIHSRTTARIAFCTIREDHSQSLVAITNEERERLIAVLGDVDNICATDPLLKDVHFDYGYALDSLRYNHISGPLQMVNFHEMVRTGFPQVNVCVDVKSDVYLYHESGFVGRPGATRYVIGNIKEKTLDDVCRAWVESGKTITPRPGDTGYLDAFDHTTSIMINQYRDNIAYGVGLYEGPVNLARHDG